jgi:hypothetical protein
MRRGSKCRSTRPTSRVLVAGVVACALVGLARTAEASEKEPIRFVYDAPRGCPTEAEFVARVAELGGAFQADPGLESARRFVVRIVPRTDADGPFSGTLRVTDAVGEETVRVVTGADCEAVTGPLSLFVSLALDDLPALPPATHPTVSLEPPASPLPPLDERPALDPQTHPNGGLSVDSFLLGSVSGVLQGSYGLRVTAVTRVGTGTRLGGSAALVNDATDAGASGWAGVLLAWGAPWTNHIVGFAMDAGVHVARMTGQSNLGTVQPSLCQPGSCFNGVPTRWTSEAPYVAATLILQVPLRRSSFRPYFGHTFLASENPLGSFAFGITLNAGVAWQAW